MTPEQLYISESFQQYFKGSPQSLILRSDPPLFTILAVSDAYLDLVHRRREDVLGKGLLEAFPGNQDDPTEHLGVLQSLMDVISRRTKTIQPLFKYEIRIGDSEVFNTFYWSSVHEPQLNSSGEVSFIINTTTNVTAQILQEQSLKESELRFQKLAESTDVLIAVSDETGAATYFNPAWTSVTGRSHEELLKDGWIDLMHPDDKEMVMSAYTQAITERQPWEREFRMRDSSGGFRWLLARGIPRFLADGAFAGHISSTVDIHAQKMLELNLIASHSRLEASENFLALVMESANIGAWKTNLTTGELELSEKSRKIMGLIDGQESNLQKFMSWIDELQRNQIEEKMHDAWHANKPFEVEYLLNPPNGTRPVWLRGTGIRSQGSTGLVLIGAVMDITDQKANEQRKNDFISMVSHELKTPLTSISGYIQLLQLYPTDHQSVPGPALLDKVKKQVNKMSALINGFLDVSRYNSSHLQLGKSRFDMAVLVKEAEEESQVSINTHKIIFEPVSPTMVMADRDKIGQVITNLIGNAVKYSPPGTEIKVACITREGSACLSVGDQGIGISRQDLPKLFERYYRVQREEIKNISGFGIGLYVCSEIIAQHGGKIWAESKLGKGSTFFFTLPVIE